MRRLPFSSVLSKLLGVAAVCGILAPSVAHAQPSGDPAPKIGGTIVFVAALDRPKRPSPFEASGGPPCELRLVDLATGSTHRVAGISGRDSLGALSFSPAGDVLVVGEDLAQDIGKTSTMWKASVLWRIDRRGRVSKLWEAPLGVLRWPRPWIFLPFGPRYVWSPDGGKIAAFGFFHDHADGDRARLYTVDVSSGEVTRRLSLPDPQQVVGWHPDGVSLLMPATRDDWQPRGVLLDHSTAVPVTKYSPTGRSARLAFRCLGRCAAIFPLRDGASVLTVEGEGIVQTNLKTGERSAVASIPGQGLAAPVPSPSGDLLAVPYLTPTFLPWEREPGEEPHNAIALFGLSTEAMEKVGLTREEPWKKLGAVPAHFPMVVLRWTADSKYIVRCTASQWFPAPGQTIEGVPLEFADGVVDVIEVETGKRWEIFRVKGHVLNIDWSPLKYDVNPKRGGGSGAK